MKFCLKQVNSIQVKRKMLKTQINIKVFEKRILKLNNFKNSFKSIMLSQQFKMFVFVDSALSLERLRQCAWIFV